MCMSSASSPPSSSPLCTLVPFEPATARFVAIVKGGLSGAADVVVVLEGTLGTLDRVAEDVGSAGEVVLVVVQVALTSPAAADAVDAAELVEV